ncbi:response regulator [Agrobacterium genomosp. 3]|uniref:response regulator n=1 Tax=Agrobacterium TaxID=357 RepID=UPI0006992585|nr:MULTISPECIES: response regulator [unclassified Agrobacterium]MCA1869036.1 response regulator [Agrobacterium tomkonis]MCA1879132.1 response regulator [Agrobacterium tumefaciens]MCA2378774.1 response regulator [Agrobacterium tomkonis RTP8]CUX66502.1 Multi-sensor hybrid histidine kinase [Agrobacterium genomosp. 5 str. CFBP 6626]KNY30763.1 histidine kinase [Agrobacterium sp. SUL3]
MPQTASQDLTRRGLGLDPVVALSLAGAIVFFLISGAFAYINLKTLRENTEAIVHSHEVIITLDELLSSTQDAETGQRGFLLTNNERYLDPYNTALDTIPAKIQEIGELTSDNPAQVRRLPILKQHVDAKLAELKQTIDLRRSQGLDAALAVVNSDRGKVAMDAVRGQLSAMSREEAVLRAKRLEEMNNAYGTALLSGVLAGILGILLTIAIGVLIRRSTLARRREEWLQAGNLGLASAMMGDQRTEQLGGSILTYLANHVGAVAGAIFVGGSDAYKRSSTYGVPADAKLPDLVRPREGLLGQVAVEGKPVIVNDVPENYLEFGSALGRDKPRHLVLAPAAIDHNVNTVIELGFLRPVDERVLAFLKEASGTIATAIRSANYRSELQNLLEETQRQSEELQVQSEELRVSNEELEEQGRALKESQARLEQQQVELEQTNSQLEEQAQQLESQKDDLERSNASTQLKARELEQASRYKSDFLANMSHELRTPLNSSLILAKLLADNPDDNLTAEQVKYAQTIQSSGNDLLNLINDILDLSKIEAGHVDIRPEPVSVERLSNNLRQVFEPIAKNKSLGFEIDISPECPAVIETDLQRIEQILKNLLSNAFKFTEKGKVTLSMNRTGDGQVAFGVTDTGIGIAPEQQKRIFEAFHQADGTISRKFGGTGLGLSISRELVRLLGGTIHIRSQEGKGSTLTVTLPLAYDPAIVAPRAPVGNAVPLAPAASAAPSQPTALLPRAIVEDDRAMPSDERRILLVVEDDQTFAAILRDLAREMGFRSLVAGTAQDALNLAQQFMPSAIVLDVGLPDQSGLSVLDRLKRDVRTRHIPIHIVSGDDYTETALSLGAVGYMLKPVQREQLVEVLHKLEAKLTQGVRRVLIVEDNEVQREAVAKLLTSHDVETVSAGTAAETLALLKDQTFDCMVLDLSLPDASGYSLLETISQEDTHSFPPVIVYTGRVLASDEEEKLRRYSKSIIIKGAKSPERLLDEVSLFLHQVVSELPDEQQKMIRKARHRDALLEGRRILIVEDDVRNVYALTNILEPRGALIQIARNGQEALDALEKSSADDVSKIDLVLMDVMMPVMDGLTATRAIRKNPDWKKLPIITLTAKAMPDDQQRCIDAGANDYMAKPLDVEKLLSLVRVWMPR